MQQGDHAQGQALMAAHSIIPDILAILDPYLEAKLAEFSSIPDDRRTPTLPATPDGKLNVTGLVRELRLKSSDVQHFHRKRELFDVVNMAAEAMGLAPIGSRMLDDEAAQAVRAKIAKLGKSEKRTSEDLVEALRRIDMLTAENEAQRLRILALEAQLAAIYETGDRPFHDPFGEGA
jgi:hypothetical protein